MSTLLVPISEPEQHLLLDNVSWAYYDRTLHELDGRHLRITFDRGKLEIMTLGDIHERVKKTVARLLEMYAIERDMPITGLGSITCRRADLQQGLEPDECYYVRRQPPSPTEGELDLERYEAPDLAIEVDVTSSSIPRQPIYAALNVLEVWRFDGTDIVPLLRQATGKYVAAERSIAFPDLPLDIFNRFLRLAIEGSQHEAVKAFRDWLRQNPSPGTK
jgi:Uma2 family endonuclease